MCYVCTLFIPHHAHRGVLGGWVASTLGATVEDRMSGDVSRLSLVKWTMDDFQVWGGGCFAVHLEP